MNIDFHTHGKLAKYLPFSKKYTTWHLTKAKDSILDAICLTEHFNTLGFEDLYNYIYEQATVDGDSLVIDDLRIFPGMEVDIKDVGHTLVLASFSDIMDIHQRLRPNRSEENFIEFGEFLEILRDYDHIFGAAHPFRDSSSIGSLSSGHLAHFDFVDLNGKDLARDFDLTLEKSKRFASMLNIPLVCGSDTHQALQFGSNWTFFYDDIKTLDDLRYNLEARNFEIGFSDYLQVQVQEAGLIKSCLKKVHDLGGDYVDLVVDR